MEHSRYIGRVGALAVALGVGAAIASSPATAWAQDSDATATSSASAGSDSPGDTETNSSATESTRLSARTKPAARDAADDAGESGEADDAQFIDGEDAEDADDVDDDEDVDDVDGADDVPGEEAPPSGHDADPVAGGSAPIGPDDSPETVDHGDSETDDSSVPSGAVSADTEPDPATDNADSSPVSGDSAGDVADDTAVAAGPDTQTTEDTQATEDTQTTTWMPLTAVGQDSPTGSPLLDALLAWLRRTFVAPLYNRAPTARPVVIGEDADGDVIGMIGAIDPDGERLLYRLATGPKYGDVVINADGTVTYTPNSGLAQNGGDDTFTIEVRDTGLRLLSRNAVISVPIEVTVGAGGILGIGGTPFAVAMSRDGRSAYVTDTANNRVSVIDIATRAVVDSIDVGGAPHGITVGSDGRAYVVNSDDSTMTVIDTTTNTVVGVPLFVGNSPTSVVVNAAGTRVYVTNSNDDTISVIDTTTFDVTRVVVGNGAFGLATDGDRVYVTNEFDDTVTVLDAETNEVISVIGVGNAPTGIAVGGGRIVVTNSGSSAIGGDGTVTIIDADTLSVIGDPIALGETPMAVVVDADGIRAYITDLGADTVSILDLTTGTLIGEPIRVAAGLTGIDIGSDGLLYVAGSHDGVVAPVTLDRPAVRYWGPIVPLRLTAPTAATSVGVAAAAVGPNRSQYTIGFNVYNYTRDTLTLTSFVGDARPDGGAPFVGYSIPPGGVQHFEVGVSYWGTTVQAVFSNSNGEKWTAKMTAKFMTAYGIPTGTEGYSETSHSGGTGTGMPGPDRFFGGRGGTDISFLEAEGTAVTMGPEAGQARVDLMNSLCNSGRANCLLKLNGEAVKALSDPHPPRVAPGTSSILDNRLGPIQQSSSVKYTETEATKLSIEGSTKFSVGVKDSWGAEISSKIGKEWASTKSWEETKPLVAPAFTMVELLVRTPVWRMTGDVTIQLGNTFITMPNITIEAPDYDRAVQTFYRYTPEANAPTTTLV